MKKKLIVLSGFVLALMLVVIPVVALAQTTGGPTGNPCNVGNFATASTIQDLLCRIGNILNAVVPILVALGVVYFVYGVITYVIASDEEAKKKGRDRIIFGIIGLAVIVAVWGLVRILTRTFGLDNQRVPITYPTVPLN
ncbi:hypothetical protein A2814_00385 [Candidatus Nomurabacteria bacterium RIFCSPHIGHO2_01_FULL_38_19]|uniref:DUF4190 domain-containing protein n=1 Tax=Candidatus Nomurabacteria bacterium RIFCSPHIGHO2_01_FULL_38_19 TaxID=1801732 RepID=A0A1F6UR03_9BACT|nr:MAG: hypothetical protein A2814_00385 [Candidatus Nomurabacteria bacterium RIFCSPHIGHO2_01_FULL_38_19]